MRSRRFFERVSCSFIITLINLKVKPYEIGVDNIQPNLESFRLVLKAWSQVGHEGKNYAALRASRILEWMIHSHKVGLNSLAAPDAECFDIVFLTMMPL